MNLSRRYGLFVKHYRKLPEIEENDVILRMMCHEKSFVTRMDFFYTSMIICSMWLMVFDSYLWEINVFFNSVHLIVMCFCVFVRNRDNLEEKEDSIEKDETNV